MPEISRFYGIVIRMYYNDHNPPHFHAAYGNAEGVFSIDPVALMQGQMPSRASAMILQWATLHRQELLENWEILRNNRVPVKVAPLD